MRGIYLAARAVGLLATELFFLHRYASPDSPNTAAQLHSRHPSLVRFCQSVLLLLFGALLRAQQLSGRLADEHKPAALVPVVGSRLVAESFVLTSTIGCNYAGRLRRGK